MKRVWLKKWKKKKSCNKIKLHIKSDVTESSNKGRLGLNNDYIIKFKWYQINILMNQIRIKLEVKTKCFLISKNKVLYKTSDQRWDRVGLFLCPLGAQRSSYPRRSDWRRHLNELSNKRCIQAPSGDGKSQFPAWKTLQLSCDAIQSF